MKEFKLMEEGKERKRYWEGPENKFVRLWMYAQKGLQEFNEFKYFVLVFIGFVGLLYPLNIKPDFNISFTLVIIIVIILFPVGLVGLVLFGKWHIHKAGPTEQWVRTQLGSVLKYREYNIRVRTLEVLKEILKEVKNGRQNKKNK